MPRKDSQGNILRAGEYERHNGIYGGYQYKYKDAVGRSKSISATTLKELREMEQQIQKDEWDGIKDPASTTINDCYIRWKGMKRGLKHNTLTNYRYMFEKFVWDDFGKTPIKDLKRSDVKAFYIRLIDDGKMAVNTLETIHNVLHQVLETAVEDDAIRYNPADKALREIKREHRPEPKRALTQGEQLIFQQFLRDDPDYVQWYTIFVFMLHTGLRVGEATALQWADICTLPRHYSVTVNKSLAYYHNHEADGQPMQERMNTTKTKAGERTVPLDAVARDCIKRQQEYIKTHPCKYSVDGYNDFVFVNRFGETLHQDVLNKALRRIIRDCNAKTQASSYASKLPMLPQFSCHTLRHTFCTNLCQARIEPKTIQAIMGHADIRTTMEIYAEATQHMTRRAIKEAEAQNQKYYSGFFNLDDTDD